MCMAFGKFPRALQPSSAMGREQPNQRCHGSTRAAGTASMACSLTRRETCTSEARITFHTAGKQTAFSRFPMRARRRAPKLVWADAQMVSPVDGGYPPMVDKRGFLWIATSYYNNWAPAGVNGPQCDTTTQQAATATCLYSTIVIWKPGALGLGTSPVGGPERCADHGILGRRQAAE